jgi:hypothetical protein
VSHQIPSRRILIRVLILEVQKEDPVHNHGHRGDVLCCLDPLVKALPLVLELRAASERLLVPILYLRVQGIEIRWPLLVRAERVGDDVEGRGGQRWERWSPAEEGLDPVSER